MFGVLSLDLRTTYQRLSKFFFMGQPVTKQMSVLLMKVSSEANAGHRGVRFQRIGQVLGLQRGSSVRPASHKKKLC